MQCYLASGRIKSNVEIIFKNRGYYGETAENERVAHCNAVRL
jgi:hypothetical protein